MKKIILPLILLLASSVFAQTPCSFDPAWDGDGRLVADGSRLAEHFLIQQDGKLVVACNKFGDGEVYLKRYNTDGTVDASFGTNGKFTVEVAERRTDIDAMTGYNGVIYICGTTTTDVGGTNTYVYAAAVNANGGFDTSFGTNGIVEFKSQPTDFYKVYDIEADGAGNLFLVGNEWLDNMYVLKMNTSGALDASFDGDGIVYLPTNNPDHWIQGNALAIDQDGKVVVTGMKYRANNGTTIPFFRDLFVARYNANGTPDNSFATGGIGYFNSAPGNYDEGTKIHVTSANAYIATGSAYDGDDYDYTALKLDNNGAPETAFGTNGWVVEDLIYANETESSFNSALLPDGRILMTGGHGTGDTVYFSMLMLHPDGSRDQAFAPDGVWLNIFNQNNNSSSKALAVDATGKIYLGGYTRTCANGICGPLYMAISRYNNTFNTTAVTDGLAAAATLYPNPVQAGEALFVEGISPDALHSLDLTDVAGRTVRITHEGAGRFRLPALAPGVYIGRIFSENEMWVKKVLVK